MNRFQKANQGLTLIELALVVAISVLFGFLIFSGVPSSREKAQAVQINCASNLKQQGLALRTFLYDHDGNYPMELSFTNDGQQLYSSNKLVSSFQGIAQDLGTLRILTCPSDKRNSASNVNDLKPENVSYFLNLDVKDGMTKTIVSGDRNLETFGQPVKPGLFAVTSNTVPNWTGEMHSKNWGKRIGIILLSDGSVRRVTNDWADIIKHEDISTNRLLIP